MWLVSSLTVGNSSSRTWPVDKPPPTKERHRLKHQIVEQAAMLSTQGNPRGMTSQADPVEARRIPLS